MDLLPVLARVVIIDSAMLVSMKTTAAPVVIFDRNEAGPRLPNAVCVAPPPKAPAKSAPSSRLKEHNQHQDDADKNVQRYYRIIKKHIILEPAFRRPLGSVVDDAQEALRFQACATDQCTVDIRLPHQCINILRFDAAAV